MRKRPRRFTVSGSASLTVGFLVLWRKNSGEDDLVAFFESDDRLFPIGRLAGLGSSLAAKFAADVHRIDSGDFDLEQFLNGLADLGFVRARIGDDGILIEGLALPGAFFSQPNGPDNFEIVHSSVGACEWV